MQLILQVTRVSYSVTNHYAVSTTSCQGILLGHKSLCSQYHQLLGVVISHKSLCSQYYQMPGYYITQQSTEMLENKLFQPMTISPFTSILFVCEYAHKTCALLGMKVNHTYLNQMSLSQNLRLLCLRNAIVKHLGLDPALLAD